MKKRISRRIWFSVEETHGYLDTKTDMDSVMDMDCIYWRSFTWHEDALVGHPDEREVQMLTMYA